MNILVGVFEILRFALDDKFKKDLLRNCIIKSKSTIERGCFLPTMQRT